MKRIIALFLALIMLFSFTACKKDKDGDFTSTSSTSTDNTTNSNTNNNNNNSSTDTDNADRYVYVKMTVQDYGDIILELDKKAAPITVANFVKLVNEGFYDGLTFHRVISDFVIQGGDPLGNGMGGSSETIKGEFAANGHNNPIKHERGVISMARSSDKNSASSQFFICNGGNVSHLDGQYAAFGHVIYGMNVVDLITTRTAPLATDMNGSISKDDQPVISKMIVLSVRKAEIYTEILEQGQNNE